MQRGGNESGPCRTAGARQGQCFSGKETETSGAGAESPFQAVP